VIRPAFSAALGPLLTLLASGTAAADDVRVAVAANFLAPARALASAFETETGNAIAISSGSTGQLYAQIANGAPFDVFLAADEARPRKAEADGLAVAGSFRVYAIGKLALFSAQADFVNGPATLKNADIRRIAIANPDTAPYGRAAVETLEALGLYDTLQGKLIQGASVIQAYQFAATGNADLAFVALSELSGNEHGSQWTVPDDLHGPIAQAAVLLSRAAEDEIARAFLGFLEAPEARTLIEGYGYALPETEPAP